MLNFPPKTILLFLIGCRERVLCSWYSVLKQVNDMIYYPTGVDKTDTVTHSKFDKIVLIMLCKVTRKNFFFV